jgi:uncharacterized membrane protein YfcA
VHFAYWKWIWLGAAAFCSGLSKTGIAGLGIVPVVIFANLLPARESTGALLPLLLCGDVFGVVRFRKHASWPHLWRLFTWVIVGVIAGYFALGRVNDAQLRRIIGVPTISPPACRIRSGSPASSASWRGSPPWWPTPPAR